MQGQLLTETGLITAAQKPNDLDRPPYLEMAAPQRKRLYLISALSHGVFLVASFCNGETAFRTCRRRQLQRIR